MKKRTRNLCLLISILTVGSFVGCGTSEGNDTSNHTEQVGGIPTEDISTDGSTTELEYLTEEFLTENTSELHTELETEYGTESEISEILTESESQVSSEILTENENQISSETPTESEDTKQSETSESETPTESHPIVNDTPTESESETLSTITEMNEVMYAKSSVNVRSGPSQNYEKVGALTSGQEVKVTGKDTQTGWYRIEYTGGTGFVSNNYLQSEPIEVAPTPTVPNTPTASSIEAILNSAPLNPKRSTFDPLNEQIDIVFSKVIRDNMTTYEKVKACYDYLINNCSYGHNETAREYTDLLFTDVWQDVYAYGMLKGKIGVCDDYSAAFAKLMNALGLNCYTVSGQTSKAGGGYTGHTWCEMYIKGKVYVFDPQVEDNIAKGGTINYYRFCKKYEEVPNKYIKGDNGTSDYEEETPSEETGVYVTDISWEEKTYPAEEYKYGVLKSKVEKIKCITYSDGTTQKKIDEEFYRYDTSTYNATADEIRAESEANAVKYANSYKQVLDLINEIRTEAGVAPLTLDTAICNAASMQALAQDYSDGRSNGGPSGSSNFYVLDYYGIEYGSVGMNATSGTSSAVALVDGMKNWSYENLISEQYSKLGVGYSNETSEYGSSDYWVLIFLN